MRGYEQRKRMEKYRRLVKPTKWLSDDPTWLIRSSPSAIPKYGRGTGRRAYSKDVPKRGHRPQWEGGLKRWR